MHDYEKEFASRLAQLRIHNGFSARDMSLALGQNHGYINSIENGKALPSMTLFFYICEYLQISPQEFFDTTAENPEKLRQLVDNIKMLDNSQLEAVDTMVKCLLNPNKP